MPSCRPGHVAQVIQAGYMIGDRVLRPAMVAVVKAAPKAPPAVRQRQSARRTATPNSMIQRELDPVAHRAEAGEQRIPIVLAADADDAQKAAAAETHPLHQR